MTITLKTTSVQEKEFELPIPFFAANHDGTEYIGLLDESTYVNIFQLKDMTILQNSKLSEMNKSNIVKAWETWHSCTESQFLEKYDSVIESISLHPRLAV